MARLKPSPAHFAALFALGAALRLLLAWLNPPGNAFDDHFEPIVIILNTGALPAKDACFQCYHPPVFYWISAQVAKAALWIGAGQDQLAKILQLVVCGYGILTLAVCYGILRRLALPPLAALLAFGTLCLLPRHIYMSAMHSNDTLSYLMVALCVYAAIVAVQARFSTASLAALGALLTVAIFTKYTAFSLLPAVPAAMAVAWRAGFVRPRSALAAAALTLALPLAVLAAHMAWNVTRYDAALPSNLALYNPVDDRPRDPGGIEFATFAPWQYIPDPSLAPGRLHSFWSLIYAGMWFDSEPYFLRYLDPHPPWWGQYIAWYRGEARHPGPNARLSLATRLTSSALMVLGLGALALLLVGLVRALMAPWKAAPERASIDYFLVTLLACNLAGVVLLTLEIPVFNTMKASYVLASTPALLVLLARGLAWWNEKEGRSRVAAAWFGALFAVSTAHSLILAGALARG